MSPQFNLCPSNSCPTSDYVSQSTSTISCSSEVGIAVGATTVLLCLVLAYTYHINNAWLLDSKKVRQYLCSITSGACI